MQGNHPADISADTESAADFASADEQNRRALPWSLGAGIFNSIFALWTFNGSVFLLFLNELGLPKAEIGALLSLFPFCGLLALGFAPVAARLGRKRVFLACYGSRKVVMAGLLLLPWVVAAAGLSTAMLYLFFIVIVFAVLRSLAETAYFPWLQQFVPNAVRGKYAAVAIVLGAGASSIALLIARQVLDQGVGLSRYLLLLGIGSVLGLIGVAMMARVPGGEPVPATTSRGTHLADMAEALRDSNFIAYLVGMGAVTIGTMLLISFLPLYVKDNVGLPSGTVVALDTAIMLGGVLASFVWGWLADRVGSRPVLTLSAGLCILVPVGWVALSPQAVQVAAFCAALYFIYGVASNGINIGAGRLLFNSVIPHEKSAAYTAIYYAWMGVTGGLAPLLAGQLLSITQGWRVPIGASYIDGNMLLFILSTVVLVLGWYTYRMVRPDDQFSTRSAIQSGVAKLARMAMRFVNSR